MLLTLIDKNHLFKTLSTCICAISNFIEYDLTHINQVIVLRHYVYLLSEIGWAMLNINILNRVYIFITCDLKDNCKFF